uniref:Uncharacterized protein n=1 Tax=viral metagenome TaxID=1070528 RepID=A0A6C0IB45_9ZZZZ
MATQYPIDISSVLSKFDERCIKPIRCQTSPATMSPSKLVVEGFQPSDQSNREFIPIIQQLESYTTEHIIFIDNRPIHLVRFLPFYDDVSNQTLFTLQYLYLNEIDSISFQLTVTKNGYGYSSSGRKYEFKCIKKDEYYCICEKV